MMLCGMCDLCFSVHICLLFFWSCLYEVAQQICLTCMQEKAIDDMKRERVDVDASAATAAATERMRGWESENGGRERKKEQSKLTWKWFAVSCFASSIQVWGEKKIKRDEDTEEERRKIERSESVCDSYFNHYFTTWVAIHTLLISCFINLTMEEGDEKNADDTLVSWLQYKTKPTVELNRLSALECLREGEGWMRGGEERERN